MGLRANQIIASKRQSAEVTKRRRLTAAPANLDIDVARRLQACPRFIQIIAQKR
jgi:hypothetical protein